MFSLLGHQIAQIEGQITQERLGLKQTLQAVENIPSIKNYWVFEPNWEGSSNDRPVILCLHGNSLKMRDHPNSMLALDFSGARLFASYPHDFELNHLPPSANVQGQVNSYQV